MGFNSGFKGLRAFWVQGRRGNQNLGEIYIFRILAA